MLKVRKYFSKNDESSEELPLADYSNMNDKYEEGQRISRCCSCLPQWYITELKEAFYLAVPLVLTYLCQSFFSPICLKFCGILGTTSQAGAALAITILNMECTAMGAGLASACDTLLSQTFGSKNKKKAGIYVQQGFIILSLAVFFCWAINLNVFSILTATGQDEAIARVAADYLFFAMPGIACFFLYQVVVKYLINQGKVLPGFIIGLIANVCNVCLHAIFIVGLGYGTNSSALAVSISYFCMLLCGIIYLKCSKVCEESWDGWTWESFHHWGDFMKLAIPGMLMLLIESFSFEVSAILAGLLGDVQISAQAIMLQVEVLFIMAPFGISCAANIRVGMYLGGNNTDGAKKAAITAFTLTGMFCLFGATVLLLSNIGAALPKVFSNDPKVISYAASLLPLQAFFHILDGFNLTSSGILRGCGRQAICSVITFIGFYVLGLPVGIPLMFLTSLEVKGYWVGLIIAVSMEIFSFVILIKTTNWEGEAQMALKRAGVKLNDSGEFETEYKPLISSSEEKTCLIVRRSLEIGTVLLIFGAGVLLHFYFSAGIRPLTIICEANSESNINPLELYSKNCNITS